MTRVVPSLEQLKHSQIPAGCWGAEPTTVPGDVRFGQAIQRYVENIKRFRKGGQGLLLTGKHMHLQVYGAAAVLKGALRAGYSAFYVSANEMQRAVIRNEYASHDEVGEPVTTVDYATSVDFLWLGGLGLEYLRDEDSFARSVVENLLHDRFLNRRPTIISSPCSIAAIGERYERIIGACLESGYLHHIEPVPHAER